MQKKLKKLQAYNAMLTLLEEFYEKEKSDYLGDILSNSEFLSDKIPGDRGSWSDWQKAIRVTALQDKTFRNLNRLTSLQAGYAMFNYIHNYVSFYDPKPNCLTNLLEILKLLLSKKNKQMWQEWLRIIDKIIKMPDPRYYLEFESNN